MPVLLDSTILADHLNGIPGASEYILNNFEAAAISVVTRSEVLVGADTHDKIKHYHAFLSQFPILPVEVSDADSAARIRRACKRIKLPDALQAAIAKNYNLKLVTRDKKLVKNLANIGAVETDVPYELPKPAFAEEH